MSHMPDPLPAELARHATELDNQLRRARHDLMDFAHIAAHDLKEPFRTINFQASFILDDYRATLPEDAIKKLEGIQKAAVRGSKLVDEMMRFAKSGDVHLGESPVELGALVYEAASSIPDYKEKRAHLTIDPLPTLSVDPVAITQVFQNLLTNAVRYNKSEAKKVRVFVREPGNKRPGEGVSAGLPDGNSPECLAPCVQVCVADNGVGIPPTQRATAFRIFKRLHRDEEFGPGGGVGLAIVKKVVEAHGGQVAIEENLEGQGTVVVLTLPRR